jgi:hypothetical protein
MQTAVAIGLKTVETRSWSTRYRGPLAIHAAKTKKGLALFPALEDLPDAPELLGGLPYGAIVATCQLVACWETETLRWIDDTEALLGDFSPRRFAWILEDVQRLPIPIPVQGARGLFDVSFPGDPA